MNVSPTEAMWLSRLRVYAEPKPLTTSTTPTQDSRKRRHHTSARPPTNTMWLSRLRVYAEPKPLTTSTTPTQDSRKRRHHTSARSPNQYNVVIALTRICRAQATHHKHHSDAGQPQAASPQFRSVTEPRQCGYRACAYMQSPSQSPQTPLRRRAAASGVTTHLTLIHSNTPHEPSLTL
ncbi:Unannotated [Lentimonas sp. CC4]|nr:Unannotated [Lentimonas sp. CC4]